MSFAGDGEIDTKPAGAERTTLSKGGRVRRGWPGFRPTAGRVCPEAPLWGRTAEASGGLAGRSGTQTRTWLSHHEPEVRGRLPGLCVISS